MLMTTIAGYMVSEPEVKDMEYDTPRGKQNGHILSFRMAARQQSRKVPTLWFRVSIWDDLAHQMESRLRQGTYVVVHCSSLHPNSWINKNTGEIETTLEVNARGIEICSRQSPDETPENSEPDSYSDERL